VLPVRSEYVPTAQHSDAEVHATLYRKLPGLVSLLGEVTIDHNVPSHRSIRVLPPASPTAQHSDADAHVTLHSVLPVVLATAGEATGSHNVPSHFSMSV
jgi:hypothetical protein